FPSSAQARQTLSPLTSDFTAPLFRSRELISSFVAYSRRVSSILVTASVTPGVIVARLKPSPDAVSSASAAPFDVSPVDSNTRPVNFGPERFDGSLEQLASAKQLTIKPAMEYRWRRRIYLINNSVRYCTQ